MAKALNGSEQGGSQMVSSYSYRLIGHLASGNSTTRLLVFSDTGLASGDFLRHGQVLDRALRKNLRAGALAIDFGRDAADLVFCALYLGLDRVGHFVLL